MIILLCIIWFYVGSCSFIYWWTIQFDFTETEIPFVVLGGIVGPATFLLGFITHNEGSRKIVKKKGLRKNK